MRALVLAIGVLLWSVPPAYAQNASFIELLLPSCLEGSERSALVESARLELSGEGAVLVEAGEAGATRIAIAVSCDTQLQAARLSLERASDGTRAERFVQVADVPPALRARTLALALAELWRSSAASSGLNPQPAKSLSASSEAGSSEPPVPAAMSGGAAPAAAELVPVTPEPRTPAAVSGGRPAAGAQAAPVDSAQLVPADNLGASQRGLALELAPALRMFFDARDVLAGAQLALRWSAWRIGAEGFYGSSSDVLGEARFGILQGFMTWELLRLHFDAYGITLGPRAAVGGMLAQASPTLPYPARGSSTAVVSWDAAAEAAFSRSLTERWSIALRLQAGYAHGVRLASDVGDLARLHGLFAAASLAIQMQVTD